MATFFNKIKPAQIGQLKIDAKLSEMADLTSKVTSNPVETGKTIQNNIVTDPAKITFVGYISNAPIQILGGLLNKDVNNKSRAQSAHDYLYNLWAGQSLITVVTKYKVYKNMAITNLTPMQNRQTGDGLDFTIQLSQINFVSSKTVKIPGNNVSPKNSKDKQAQSTQDAGEQTPTKANNQQSSYARQIVDNWRGQ